MTVDDGARTTLLEWDARGCLVRTRTTSPNLVEERHVCAGDGRRVYRNSRELNAQERVLDPFGVFEVRPDTNVLLLTLPVGATTSYEEAYDLGDGAFREAESGYRHLDARGSVVARSDFGAGGVAEEAVYGPWGEVLDVGLTTVTPEHTFLGSEADSGTGWHRFGPRAYDPTLRRWTSADPLALAAPSSVGRGDLGLFSYAANNPTTFTDKTGLIADRPMPEIGPQNPEHTAFLVLAGAVIGAAVVLLARNPKLLKALIVDEIIAAGIGVPVSPLSAGRSGGRRAVGCAAGCAGDANDVGKASRAAKRQLEREAKGAKETLTKQLGRKPTKKELKNFEAKSGVSAKRNAAARKKAKQQEADDVGGETEHTTNKTKSNKEVHQAGQARKKADQERSKARKGT